MTGKIPEKPENPKEAGIAGRNFCGALGGNADD